MSVDLKKKYHFLMSCSVRVTKKQSCEVDLLLLRSSPRYKGNFFKIHFWSDQIDLVSVIAVKRSFFRSYAFASISVER